MSKRLALVCGIFIGAAAFAGCGGDDSSNIPDEDSGTSDGGGKIDGGAHDGSVIVDSSSGDSQGDATQSMDSGADASHDGGVDAAHDATADSAADAPIDAPVSDAADGGSAVSAQIQAVRNAADIGTDGGADAGSLPIDGALVTYVKPLVGTDVAGFFVQGEKLGPAVFVGVDPATLSPVPVAGDRVSFDVTSTTKVASLRQVSAIANFTRQSQGNSLTSLVQDVSNATDLVTALDSYESELVSITGGTISAAFVSSSTGFLSATIDTTAITGNASLKLRVPTTVHDALDLAQGCVVTLPGTPLWRFNTSSEPSGWVSGDVTVMTCPAPKVLSATALSATSVQITFDRLIATGSVNVNQFTFNNGLTASAAVVSGKTVTVTTSAQTGGTSYTATVATTVTDTHGATLNPANTTATFNGYQVLAQLLINEVNPNLSGSTDLVELRVVGAGDTAGIKLQQGVAGPTTLATLPSIAVAVGDLIVVHMTPATNSVTTETTTKADCVATACYAGAWDVAGGTTGITFSNQVLRLLAPDGTTTQDAVPFAIPGSTTPAAFLPALQAIQAAGLWLPANCGGALCDYTTSNPTAPSAVISVDWSSIVTATSAQRHVATDNNIVGDWQIATSSFGLANP